MDKGAKGQLLQGLGLLNQAMRSSPRTWLFSGYFTLALRLCPRESNMATISPILLVLGFAGHGLGHFILQDPRAIGTRDSDQAIAPCGGYDPTSRVDEVDWPVGGRALYVISTHLTSLWSFKAALLNSTDDWVDLGPQVYQNGFGHICLPNIPGVEAWVGQEGVVQVIQDASHGILYQVRFLYTPHVLSPLTEPVYCGHVRRWGCHWPHRQLQELDRH